jgi:uncharacterized tellurite resistance protein B-like protein
VMAGLVDSIVVLVDSRPLPTSPVSTRYHEDDDDLEPNVSSGLGDAEGQSFIIEYLDSRGRESRRPITVLELVLGKGDVPCLFARCHLRQKVRQFRVDRIKACIDYDGEIFDDVAQYLADSFGMSVAVASRRPDIGTDQRWKEIVEIVRAEAVLLAALSQCDGKQHEAETEAAVVYLAGVVERAGTFLSDDEISKIGAFVTRLRPTVGAIDRALVSLSTLSPERIRRFLMSAAAVIKADGRLHIQETALLNDMAEQLIGTRIS